jgi:hypothetical protein
MSLLAEARAAGIIFTLNGDSLVARGPRSVDSAWRDRITANRGLIIEALRAERTTQQTFLTNPTDGVPTAPMQVVSAQATDSLENTKTAQNKELLPWPGWPDPRPDRVDDHDLWVQLLFATGSDRADPKGLFQALHGFRCLGAQLVAVSTGGAKLERGTISESDWAFWRKEKLLPHADRLKTLLGELRG